ncbi:MAG: hypothetical protein J2P26_11785 [Nocardiopsaceae bacterium]|nr:hypothetical protein [Nocardiopsaceae bacterium]
MLNPRHTVRRILGRAQKRQGDPASAAERGRLLGGLTRAVRLPDWHLDVRSAALSGGLKQRVAIARGPVSYSATRVGVEEAASGTWAWPARCLREPAPRGASRRGTPPRLARVEIIGTDSANDFHTKSTLRGHAGLGESDPVTRIEDLPTIAVPSMFIHGRDDRVGHCEQSLHLTALAPGSRLVLLNRCGHWAVIEHAGEFNRLVASFVASN